MFYAYKITNKINNKVYIGQTNNLSLRWAQHKYNAIKHINAQVITRAISKYEIKGFEFSCIASCKTQDDVDETEIELIRQYDCLAPKGYNIDTGGKSPRSPETLKKISIALNRYYETHDGHLKGKKLT